MSAIAKRDTGAPVPTAPSPVAATPRPRPLLSEITIDYGPRQLFADFFPKAIAAAEAEGVALSFVTLTELLAINRDNSKTWMPLVPVFDHRTGVTDDETFCFVGRNRTGDVIATQAARLYAWTTTSLYEETNSLRLFYKDPDRMKLPGETMTTDAPTTRSIAGRAVFSGAVWNHPDWRRGILSSLLPRICRTYAHTRWASDFTFSYMSKKLVAAGVAERVGYRNIEGSMYWRSPAVGNYEGSLIWMDTGYLIQDLRDYLGRLEAKVDPVVHRRRA